jgi:hypothetical protein
MADEPGSAPAEATEPQEPVVEEQAQAGEEPQEAATAEKKHEPAPGSPRWNEIYRKTKDQDRYIAQLEARLATQSQPQQPKGNDPVAVIQYLRDQRDEALSKLDLVAGERINDQIRNIENQLWARHNEEVIKGTTSRTTELTVVENFAKQTDWFNENKDSFDEKMAVYAIHLKGKMAPSWRGSLPDLLDEVKQRTEEAFGYTRKGTQQKQAVSYVNPGGQAQKTVKSAPLTADERKVAETYFSNEKDPYTAYAAAKARSGRS